MKACLAVLLLPTIASADSRTVALADDGPPSLTAPAQAGTTQSTYISLGFAGGGGAGVDWMYGGASIEAGYRLSDSTWVHGKLETWGRVGYGTTNDITIIAPEHGAGAALVGLDKRWCHRASLCALAGVDAGAYVGSSLGLMVVPHLGLDVGGEHLRFRPSVEGSLIWADRGAESEVPGIIPDPGLGVDLAVAYQW